MPADSLELGYPKGFPFWILLSELLETAVASGNSAGYFDYSPRLDVETLKSTSITLYGFKLNQSTGIIPGCFCISLMSSH